ncbi:MAG: hypothetical protein QOJ00_2933 [Actinomycetota bacterium]|jgi:hypothetical protein
MADYTVNKRAVARATHLIDAHQYVLDSDWGLSQPDADTQNAYIEAHGWRNYAEWHIGLTKDANDETKARYAFTFGDFRRVHRTALIACVYRASEWRHKGVEIAAHNLLQHLDAVAAKAARRQTA